MLLCAGAVLIALNWLIFIYAIAQQHLLQASLGYFINPLFSIALGMIFLRERLRPWQWLAVFIASISVINLTLRGTGLPWIAVSLAASFALYGLVRKSVDINSLHGLTIESAILLPVVLVVLVFLPSGAMAALIYGCGERNEAPSKHATVMRRRSARPRTVPGPVSPSYTV